MPTYRADLHIHSLLSPCADLDLSPRAIVSAAKQQGLDAIAVCDHNSLKQLPEIERLAHAEGIYLFIGAEITTCEEVHLISLFPSLEKGMQMQQYIDQHLIKFTHDAERFGDQIWVDSNEQIVGEVTWYLNAPLTEHIDKVVDMVHHLQGVAIAAHVDRASNSISSQLGFVPDNLPLDALEYQRDEGLTKILTQQPHLNTMSHYKASDAHFKEHIGTCFATLQVETLNFMELTMAMHHQNGRYIK